MRTAGTGRHVAVVLLALTTGLAAPVEAAPVYSVVDLGVLPGYDSSVAYDVNDRGEVVGTSYLASHSAHESAFRFSSGQMSNLGTLGGWRSNAKAINNAGIVVGQAMAADGSVRAYRYDSSMADIGVPGEALGINDAGTIVGVTTSGLFVVASSVPIDAAALDARWGWDINSRGDFVGTTRSGPHPQGYVYRDGVQTQLGFLGSGQVSNAYAINDGGDIVGESLTGGSSDSGHAFLWMSGFAMIDLGVVGADAKESVAWDTNNRREVIGTLRLKPGGRDSAHGFYWADGVMSDLNDLLASDSRSYTIITANGINNLGQIVGSAIAPNGLRRAVLLTPENAVPEPATLALFVLAVLSVVWQQASRAWRGRARAAGDDGPTSSSGAW